MKRHYKIFLVWLSAISLAVIPVSNMIEKVFLWHIRQPESYEGIAEVLIFVLIVFLMCRLRKDSLFISTSAMVLVYMTKQGVVIPALSVLIYFEVLSYIGFSFVTQREEDTLVAWNFITGCCVWGTAAIVCSALNFGTINELRIVTFFLLVGAIIQNRNKHYYPVLFRLRCFCNKIKAHKVEQALFIVLAFVVAVLCAKSNTAIDYDSIWYGLRPEKVLVGENSFYDYLGYTAFVYYYPKLMELLFLPISDLNDYSFIICGNIGVFCLCMYVVFQYLDRFTKSLSMPTKLIIVLAICSVPALANIAATAKPDILGFFFTLLAFYYATGYFRGNSKEIWPAFICLALCTGTKLTYLLWGGILFLFLVIHLAVTSVTQKGYMRDVIRSATGYLTVGILCLFLVLGVHARTLLLTGFPLYPTGTEFFSKIGFTAKNYAAVTRPSRGIPTDSALSRIYQFLFDPTQLAHVIMLWPSNLMAVCIVMGFAFFKKDFLKGGGIWMVLLCVINILATLYFEITQLFPDGNYFIFSIGCITLTTALLVDGEGNIQLISKIYKPLSVLIIANLIMLFISHSSWQWGTKPFDIIMVNDNMETSMRNENIMNYHGLAEIDAYLSQNMRSERIISSVFEGAEIPERLCSGVETVDIIANDYFTDGQIFQSFENFEEYIRNANIKGFVVEHNIEDSFSDYVNRLFCEGKVYLAVSDASADLFVMSG